MKKHNSFLFMLSLTILAIPTLYGGTKKKSKGYSLTTPSLSSLNPFGGSPQKEVVLDSDQKQKPRKKEKQKSSVVAKAPGMGFSLMGAPSRMAKRVVQGIRSIGPNTLNYVSSEKGKQQIKSALKTGLYYGFPVVAFVGGFKLFADRQQQSFQALRDQFTQQEQQLQQLQLQNPVADELQQLREQFAQQAQQMQQQNQQIHQQVVVRSEVLADGLDQINQGVQANGAAIEQVQNGVNVAATANQVNDLGTRVDNMSVPLRRTTANLGQLHQFLQEQQRVAVQADVRSADDAERAFKEQLFDRNLLIGLNVDSAKFGVEKSHQLVGEGNRIYTVVPVEVKKAEKSSSLAMEWATHQTAWNNAKDGFEGSMRNVFGDDVVIVPYAIEENQLKWLER